MMGIEKNYIYNLNIRNYIGVKNARGHKRCRDKVYNLVTESK